VGRRGPAPTPTKAKIAKGETRPSRLNALEPEPRDRAPRMPAAMSKEAKVVWRHVLREMPAGVITAADAHVLRLYCEALARYNQAQALYSTPLVTTRGQLVKNPLHQVIRDNADQVRVLARELGLSPAARVNLQMEQGPDVAGLSDEIGPPPRLQVVAGGA
jgi:P27 family predicted phage terminase small subunit